ncbi:hypothetical protein HVPorG_04754 (plasmid) [Roseomonas mucosa]|nr:hypothetical protein ADP8_04754 [Roseomonas mucosa]QDJ11980.1 hypothetical protein HVPorG_04754 [Roseomonas mucosa]
MEDHPEARAFLSQFNELLVVQGRLLHRPADPPRQWLAQQPHRRTHAVVLGRQKRQLISNTASMGL